MISEVGYEEDKLVGIGELCSAKVCRRLTNQVAEPEDCQAGIGEEKTKEIF